jgi:hypothetical protein
VRETGDAARIEVVSSEVKEFLRPAEISPGKPEVYRLEQRLSQERLLAWSYDFAGFFDYAGRVGKLAIAASMGDPFHRAVENYLRVVAAHAALRRGGCWSMPPVWSAEWGAPLLRPFGRGEDHGDAALGK